MGTEAEALWNGSIHWFDHWTCGDVPTTGAVV